VVKEESIPLGFFCGYTLCSSGHKLGFGQSKEKEEKTPVFIIELIDAK